MKAMALIHVKTLAVVRGEEIARALQETLELLVASDAAEPGPYEISAYDPSPIHALPRRTKRKGRGRHKAGRWGAQP